MPGHGERIQPWGLGRFAEKPRRSGDFSDVLAR